MSFVFFFNLRYCQCIILQIQGKIWISTKNGKENNEFWLFLDSNIIRKKCSLFNFTNSSQKLSKNSKHLNLFITLLFNAAPESDLQTTEFHFYVNRLQIFLIFYFRFWPKFSLVYAKTGNQNSAFLTFCLSSFLFCVIFL